MPLEAVAVHHAGQWTQLDPCEIESAAQISHGRGGVGDGPTASACSLTVITPTMPSWTPGDLVRVTADGAPRFTGTITDLTITHVDPASGKEAIIAVTAIGNVAELGERDIGTTPWPEQAVADRAAAILTASGMPFRVQGDPSIRVNSRDVDRQSALTLVTELAQDTGAAVFDTPDGVVVFQHYAARAQTWQYTLWMEMVGAWTGQDPDTTWADMAMVSPSAPLPIDLDSCAVLWEPAWATTSGQIINSCTVAYGPDVPGGERPSVTATNPASVALHGRRHVFLGGSIADAGSAMERAGMVLDVHSFPYWSVGQVTVFPGDLDDPGPVLALLCGSKVRLEGMPQPAPELAPVRIVEGWVHILTPTEDALILNVSDPLHSYAGIVWAALLPDLRWQDLDSAVVWTDAITADRLTGEAA
jgi:hypothetical protein